MVDISKLNEEFNRMLEDMENIEYIFETSFNNDLITLYKLTFGNKKEELFNIYSTKEGYYIDGQKFNTPEEVVNYFTNQYPEIEKVVHGGLFVRQVKELKKKEFIDESSREVKKIKFITVDDWNRPIFRMKHNGRFYYLSDINNLFDYGTTEQKIKQFYKDKKPLRDYITFHGHRIDDDPMGTTMRFDLEIE